MAGEGDRRPGPGEGDGAQHPQQGVLRLLAGEELLGRHHLEMGMGKRAGEGEPVGTRRPLFTATKDTGPKKIFKKRLESLAKTLKNFGWRDNVPAIAEINLSPRVGLFC